MKRLAEKCLLNRQQKCAQHTHTLFVATEKNNGTVSSVSCFIQWCAQIFVMQQEASKQTNKETNKQNATNQDGIPLTILTILVYD